MEYFISKRMWEYDPLYYSAEKYWLELHSIEREECTICYDKIPINKLWKNCPITNEKFCLNCLNNYIKNKINDGQVLIGNKIKCPCSNINCDGIIEENIILKLITDQNLIDKFHQFSLNVEISLDNKRIFCPNKQCGAVVKIKSYWSKNVTCKSCHLTFCTECRESHSALISCSMVSFHHFF